MRSEELWVERRKSKLITVLASSSTSLKINTNRCLNVASVRVLALAVENLLVKVDVVVIDGVVESDGYHHGNVLRWQISGHCGAVFGAEAIRENANGGVAWRSSIGIGFSV